MLAKVKRLNLNKEFKWVAGGQRVENSLVKLFFRTSDEPWPRIGIAPSKASFRKAIDRNRARRLTSTGFEKLYQSLIPGVKIIAMPKTLILQVGSEEVIKSLTELLGKKGLLNNEITAG